MQSRQGPGENQADVCLLVLPGYTRWQEQLQQQLRLWWLIVNDADADKMKGSVIKQV